MEPTATARPTAASGPPAPPEVAARANPMDLWISRVLRAGVLIAGAIILLGLALYVMRGVGAGRPASLRDLLAGGGRVEPTNPAAIVRGVLHGNPVDVIRLGVLALVLTPVVRVAMTMVLFLLERDRAFALITAIVLALLALGLVGVGA